MSKIFQSYLIGDQFEYLATTAIAMRQNECKASGVCNQSEFFRVHPVGNQVDGLPTARISIYTYGDQKTGCDNEAFFLLI